MKNEGKWLEHERAGPLEYFYRSHRLFRSYNGFNIKIQIQQKYEEIQETHGPTDLM